MRAGIEALKAAKFMQPQAYAGLAFWLGSGPPGIPAFGVLLCFVVLLVRFLCLFARCRAAFAGCHCHRRRFRHLFALFVYHGANSASIS